MAGHSLIWQSVRQQCCGKLGSKWTEESGQYSKSTVCFFWASYSFLLQPKESPQVAEFSWPVQHLYLWMPSTFLVPLVFVPNFFHFPNPLSPFSWPKSINSTTNQPLFWEYQFSSKLWQILPLDKVERSPSLGTSGTAWAPGIQLPASFKCVREQQWIVQSS